MKVAIMQPYLFPYIGYFQLIASVDKFILFDDVNYINRGWVNRNKILINGSPHLFTIPLKKASQNKHINDIEILNDKTWKEKFEKTLQHSYSKAPCYNSVIPVIRGILYYRSYILSSYIYNCIKEINKYIGIQTKLISSSGIYNNRELKGQSRILDICKKENAEEYINPIDGMYLYNKENFTGSDIKLHFLRHHDITYKQFHNGFIPWLSIIDVLMFNSPEQIKEMLTAYDLV